MNSNQIEMIGVDQKSQEPAVQSFQELSEMELLLVGGGMGDPILA